MFGLDFSGGSSSTSSNTNVYDKRVVGAEGSINVSADVNDSGTLNLTTTDFGAVKASLDANKSMFSGALASVSEANRNLAQAYQSGQAGDQTQLKYAGFVLVGLGALAAIAVALKGN